MEYAAIVLVLLEYTLFAIMVVKLVALMKLMRQQ